MNHRWANKEIIAVIVTKGEAFHGVQPVHTQPYGSEHIKEKGDFSVNFYVF